MKYICAEPIRGIYFTVKVNHGYKKVPRDIINQSYIMVNFIDIVAYEKTL